MSLDRLRETYAAYHRAYAQRESDADGLVRARLDLALVLSVEGELDDRVVEQVEQDARAVLQLA